LIERAAMPLIGFLGGIFPLDRRFRQPANWQNVVFRTY